MTSSAWERDMARGNRGGASIRTSWHIKEREREVITHSVWNSRDGAFTGRRRVARFTKWRPLFTDESANRTLIAFMRFKKRGGMRDLGIFYKGKRMDESQLKRKADEERALWEERVYGSPLSDDERERERSKEVGGAS